MITMIPELASTLCKREIGQRQQVDKHRHYEARVLDILFILLAINRC
jgi:hypothetical protein